jgi:ribonucleoside-diphosphate reductase alpha chain
MDYILREDDNGMILDGKIEGAPHLREEDLPVFDTANRCGTGERYIHYLGHVRMVAAITPLISGAISKTVNLPNEATVEDFANVVLTSWKLGIKGITLYRDGSKFAQPLNLRLGDEDNGETPLEDMPYHDLLNYARDARCKLAECQDELGRGDYIHARMKPQGIRMGVTHPAQIEDVKVYITVNRDQDNEIQEIFMTTDREGTLITGLLNSLSKTISVMLQYGIKPTAISKMLRGQKFEPYGFVQRHPYIKYCSSVSDLISKVLDIESGDYSRVQVRPKTEDGASEPVFKRQISMAELITKDAADTPDVGERLYDGSTCPNCSSTRMVLNGTCKVCLDCGETTGCS